MPSARDARQSCSSATSSPTTSLPDAPAPSCSRARRPTSCWFVVGAIYHEACLCWHSCNAASASATTICSSVCLGNSLMVIHSARPQAAGTTQNNPLKTNGPKNPDPSIRVLLSASRQFDALTKRIDTHLSQPRGETMSVGYTTAIHQSFESQMRGSQK